MTSNVCGREKRTRGIVSILMIVLAFIVGQTMGWIIGIVGFALLLTAMFSYCPVNALTHRNSCGITLKNPLKSGEPTNINY